MVNKGVICHIDPLINSMLYSCVQLDYAIEFNRATYIKKIVERIIDSLPRMTHMAP